MNRILILRSLFDSLWMLSGSCALFFSFVFARVWISAQFETKHMLKFLEIAPDVFVRMLPVDVEVMASTWGRLAFSYEEPIALALMSFWAVSRGSDVIAGELGRGSLEMTLAQPVSRTQWLLSHALGTVLGLTLLTLFGWLGTAVGVQINTLEDPVRVRIFLIAAANLFCLGFFLAGLSTFLSSMCTSRSRVVGIVVAFFAVQLIQKIVARAAPDEYTTLKSLGDWSFLTAFEPQLLVHNIRTEAAGAWAQFFEYNGTLIALGLVGLALSAVILQRRDLPAPL